MEHPGRKQSHAVYTDKFGKLIRPRPLFDSCAIVARRHDLVRHLPRTLLALRTRGEQLFGPATVRPEKLFGPASLRPGVGGIAVQFGQKVFDECCVGVDVERAYQRGHAECVEKASPLVNNEAVLRACRDWGDVETTHKTHHLFPFPEEVHMWGDSFMRYYFPKEWELNGEPRHLIIEIGLHYIGQHRRPWGYRPRWPPVVSTPGWLYGPHRQPWGCPR